MRLLHCIFSFLNLTVCHRVCLCEQGFNQEELEGDKQQAKAGGHKEAADDSDSDDDVDRGGKE